MLLNFPNFCWHIYVFPTGMPLALHINRLSSLVSFSYRHIWRYNAVYAEDTLQRFLLEYLRENGLLLCDIWWNCFNWSISGCSRLPKTVPKIYVQEIDRKHIWQLNSYDSRLARMRGGGGREGHYQPHREQQSIVCCSKGVSNPGHATPLVVTHCIDRFLFLARTQPSPGPNGCQHSIP